MEIVRSIVEIPRKARNLALLLIRSFGTNFTLRVIWHFRNYLILILGILGNRESGQEEGQEARGT